MEGCKIERGRKKEQFHPTLFSYCQGVGLVLWLGISSAFGVVFFHVVPYMSAMLFLRPFLYRTLADELIGSWLIYCMVGVIVVLFVLLRILAFIFYSHTQ